ncbi:hypothetical protein ACFYXV_12315 [Streptomyces sp. NPDC002181]|uniref:hypothetical protein n=1 Tax=Streptomyces sp. NPDC002181 TaxID=3364635 RepID=UPI003698D7A7
MTNPTGVLESDSEPALHGWNVTCGEGRLETVVERRKILMAGAAGGAVTLSQGALGTPARASGDPAPGHRHGSAPADDTTPTHTPPLTKFVDPLPTPVTAVPDLSAYPGADYYDVTMRQGSWRFHRDLGPAHVWGYWAKNPHDHGNAIGMGYLGPTIDVTRDRPLEHEDDDLMRPWTIVKD